LRERLSPSSVSDMGRLGLATTTARASFTAEGVPVWEKGAPSGNQRCGSSSPVVARYRSKPGDDLLAPCRRGSGIDPALPEEPEAATSFESVRELRNTVLLIAVVGAL